MSLHGSLETFALTDVLALLSSTHKTGELRIVGDRSQGSVWVDAGQVVQTAVPPARSHVDALFELLRLPSGMFTFEQGLAAPEPGQPQALEPLVVEAEERLSEWRAIEAVVPSAAVAVRLQASVDGDVRMTPEQWRMLVAAVDGGTVSSVCERLELGEFDACRGVRDLVILGLVRVEAVAEPVKTSASASAAGPASASVKVKLVEAPAAPVAAEAEAGAADGVADGDPDPLAALAAVAAATAADGATPGPDGAEDDDLRAPTAAAEDDVPLPGQPLPAWALGDDGDDDQDGDRMAEPAAAAGESEQAGVGAASLHAMATAVAAGADPESLEMVEGDEPINRGLLLKFLSSVRS